MGGFGGRHANKSRLRAGGGYPKNMRDKRGAHVKYFSNTLKQHNVLIPKELLFSIFQLPHNSLCLLPKVCINYCCEMLSGGLHISKSISQ